MIKSEGNAPKTVYSAVLNALVILAFSLVSIGLVFIESNLLHNYGFSSLEKTASINLPASGEYKIGEVFPMNIEINAVKTPINVVKTDLQYDPRHIEVVDISTKDSFANIFIRKNSNPHRINRSIRFLW